MKVRILGVPMDLGSERRGTDMGPSAMRAARLERRLEELGHDVTDGGNVATYEPETRKVRDEKIRFLAEIVRACETLAKRVDTAIHQGAMPLVLGGDHSVAVGTMAGVARHNRRVGVLWIDAHADFNTPETTPTGNVHGMPLAAITGRGDPRLTGVGGHAPLVHDANVALVAIRDIDREERELIRDSGVHVSTMRHIDERGLRIVMEEAIKKATADTDWLHVSLDMDAVDPEWAPGTGTPVPGGLTYREAHLAMEIVHDSGALKSMEIVEVN
ncbi:MAG TPA: arginase, partial [Candidatus Thermoplasmatota archaeon]